jgi:hypothetical protein
MTFLNLSLISPFQGKMPAGNLRLLQAKVEKNDNIGTLSRPGDPRINIQNDNGKAKAYQVKQVLQAIEKIESGG